MARAQEKGEVRSAAVNCTDINISTITLEETIAACFRTQFCPAMGAEFNVMGGQTVHDIEKRNASYSITDLPRPLVFNMAGHSANDVMATLTLTRALVMDKNYMFVPGQLLSCAK